MSKLNILFVQIKNYVCPNLKWYLSNRIDNYICSKLNIIFVQIENYIGLNWKLYLSKFLNVFVQIPNLVKSNWQLYLSKIEHYICPNLKLYLSISKIIFVQISKCICPNFHNLVKSNGQLYLSKLLNQKRSGRHLLGTDTFQRRHQISFFMGKVFLYKFKMILVNISKCICPNFWMYLSKLRTKKWEASGGEEHFPTADRFFGEKFPPSCWTAACQQEGLPQSLNGF